MKSILPNSRAPHGRLVCNFGLPAGVICLLSVAFAQPLGPEFEQRRNYDPAYTVTTLAGSPGLYGTADGVGSAARFDQPTGIAVDKSGNVFVADTRNNSIRKITPNGAVTTFAGQTGPLPVTAIVGREGTGANARFGAPSTLRIIDSGDLYVLSAGMTRTVTLPGSPIPTISISFLQRVSPAAVVTALFEPGPGVGGVPAQNFAVDSAGNYYTSSGRDALRPAYGGIAVMKVTPGGVRTSIAGSTDNAGNVDGAGTAARFAGIAAVGIDASGNLFVTDRENYTVRRITLAGGVTTVAGTPGKTGHVDGPSGIAKFGVLNDVVVDGTGNLFVSDFGTVRRISTDGVVTTVAGSLIPGTADGVGGTARFNSIGYLAVDGSGRVFYADSESNTIRVITPSGVAPAGSPVITAQPTSSNVTVGTGVSFSVTATGASTYQWRKDGVAIAGATAATFTLPNSQPADAGSYTVAVTNAAGSAISSPATLTVSSGPTNNFINLSVRTMIAGGQRLTAGFVIGGAGSKTVLVRAVGPTLAAFGVPGTLADPKLEVFSGTSKITENDTWSPALSPTFASVGAFALTAGSKDAALVTSLAPGAYTVQVSGADGGAGEALIEVYEVTP